MTKKKIKKKPVKKVVKKKIVKKKIVEQVRKDAEKITCLVCESTEVKKLSDKEFTCGKCGASWISDATGKDFSKAKVDHLAKKKRKESKAAKKTKVPKKVSKKPEKKIEEKKVKKSAVRKEKKGKMIYSKYSVEGTIDGRPIKTNSIRQLVSPSIEKAGLLKLFNSNINTDVCIKLIVKGKQKMVGKMVTFQPKSPKLKIFKNGKMIHEIK